jgi:hypothetical protein
MTTPAPEDVAPWIERLARVGYAAKALLYITVGYLASQTALGPGGKVTDTQGALREVHDVSYGRALLFVVALGLLGYGLWRVVEAVMDPERRGTDWKGLAVRAGFLVRGLFHGVLALTAFRFALQERTGAARDQAREWTARAFDLPAGELLVSLAAAYVAGYGAYQFYRAWSPKMQRHLHLSELPQEISRWVLAVSRFGIAARGVIFCFTGFFLIRAVLRHDAAEAGGLRESLRALAALGRWPFIAVAFGLVAYGLYELVNARYRRISIA